MNDIAQILKAELAESLEKSGSSLQEFEAALEKEAGVVLDTLKTIWGAGSGLGQAGIAAAIGGGTMIGGGLYMGDKHIQDQDKSLNEKAQEIDRLRNITGRLKTDYGLK